jgi:hypothetical protein
LAPLSFLFVQLSQPGVAYPAGKTGLLGDFALKNILLLVALVFVSDIAVAASAGTDATKPAEATVLPHGGMTTKAGAGMPSGHAKDIPADTQLVNNGKVLEVLDTDMYTYLQVTTEKGPLWIAAYKTNVTKGSTVKYSNGVAMSRFFSKALNRTFDVIVFVDSLELVK